MEEIAEILEKLKERDKILSKNPDIKLYQDKIDKALDGVEDSEKRLHIIMTIIVANYNELLNACSNYYKEFLKIKNPGDLKGIKFKDEIVGKIMWSPVED